MNEKRLKLVTILSIAAWFVFAPVALAYTNGDAPAFDAWLEAISGPAVSLAVGVLLSLGLDSVPGFKERWDGLDARVKRLWFVGLCIAVPVLAACLRALLGYVPWSFDPLIWYALWAGFGAAGIGTLVHTPKLNAG